MAQLLVRNIPDEVKDRLKRRAERHGHSLEAEVRDILSHTPELPAASASAGEGLGTLMARAARDSGVTNEDIDELERNIAEGRKNWRTRPVEFD